MTLHIIDSLSQSNAQINNCLSGLNSGDDVLFLDTGSEENLNAQKELIDIIKTLGNIANNVYLLADNNTKSPTNQEVGKHITLINQALFVELTIKHEKSITWF